MELTEFFNEMRNATVVCVGCNASVSNAIKRKMQKRLRTIENFTSLSCSLLQYNLNSVQTSLLLDFVRLLNADNNVSWLLMIKQVSDGAQDILSVHAPGTADYSHARVHENFGGQTQGKNIWKQSVDRSDNSVNVHRNLADFFFDYLGGIPMGIGDVDLSSCALQFFQTLHLEKIVVA